MMTEDCASVSGAEETATTDVMTTTTTTMMMITTATGDVEMQQQQQQQHEELDNSLMQLDAGDEGRLQIVVEDPTADDDQQLGDAQDAAAAAGPGQCAPADDHVDTDFAAVCPSTSADQLATMSADVPPVSQVVLH